MDALSAALATEGFWFLAIGAFLAGLVRGFAGFGTGLIFMPVASQVLPPVWAIVVMITLDLFGPIPAVPRALRDGHPRDLLPLGIGCVIGTPVGLFLLLNMGEDVFRYAISIVACGLLILLIGGFRYRGPVGPKMLTTTGGLAGIFGGSVGVAGPPAILLYMARDLPVSVIRANTLVFLLITDICLIFFFGLQGLLALSPILLGVLLVPIYMAAIWLGTAIFDPGRAVVYRWVAYAIIGASALGGLPIWD